ncbi:hypothetical protein QBC34DRAFT_430617 [Podospora aff. communis PSN243]|uniref:Ecp2 effector protein domain-containing protein n=1 Tax=Podospora aff. communis PSN243 TaxID=3040156 RepID=A0AAV9G6C2_9PEZI|nr:hypothetical protein QBC34DRAFT_430617 [Podospora aff. communis PSN243]
MHFSTLAIALVGSVSLTTAAPQPLMGPRKLNEAELADIHARGYNATLEKRADWALIGFSGRDCTGNLAFGYVGSTTTDCVNTNFAQSYVRDLGANYWCLNGDVRSFKAIRYIDGK